MIKVGDTLRHLHLTSLLVRKWLVQIVAPMACLRLSHASFPPTCTFTKPHPQHSRPSPPASTTSVHPLTLHLPKTLLLLPAKMVAMYTIAGRQVGSHVVRPAPLHHSIHEKLSNCAKLGLHLTIRHVSQLRLADFLQEFN